MSRLWSAVGGVGVAAMILLAGACSSGPSDADDTACKLFVAAENDLNEAINAWNADGRPDGGSDLVRLRGAERPGRVAEAADRATGDLAVEMTEAARLADLAYATGTEDAGVAYLLQADTVIEACQDLGVSITVVDLE